MINDKVQYCFLKFKIQRLSIKYLRVRMVVVDTNIYPKFKEATLDFSCVKTTNLKQHSLFFTQMKITSALVDCQSLKETYYLILVFFLEGGGSSQNTGAFTIGIYRELSFSSKQINLKILHERAILPFSSICNML